MYGKETPQRDLRETFQNYRDLQCPEGLGNVIEEDDLFLIYGNSEILHVGLFDASLFHVRKESSTKKNNLRRSL